MSKYYLPFVILLSISLFSCKQSRNVSEGKSETFCLKDKFKDNIVITAVTQQLIQEGFQLSGMVEANPNKVVHFSSLLAGIVVNVNFNLGDQVTKGQVLAEIKSLEWSNYNAELNGIQEQLKVVKSKLDAVQSMYDDGISSMKELTEAKSELNILISEQQKIRSNMQLYSSSATKGVFLIKAPASGIITAKSINSGMQISAEGEPLFTISDLNDVWVMANIYATNIQYVRQGMEVEIRTISYPDEVFRGKVSLVSHVLDNESKVLKARIELQNDAFKLKPGMVADIMVLNNSGQSAPAIASDDIIFSNNENYVLIYKSDCEIERRPISILSKNHSVIYIKEGLKEGESIITKNQLLVFEALGY